MFKGIFSTREQCLKKPPRHFSDTPAFFKRLRLDTRVSVFKTRAFSPSEVRKAFQPEFGAYRGLARGLKSPLNPQKLQKYTENLLEKGTFIICAKPWYECAKPGFKKGDFAHLSVGNIRHLPKEEGRGTTNGYEASKGSKGDIGPLIEALIEALGALIEALKGLEKHPRL